MNTSTLLSAPGTSVSAAPLAACSPSGKLRTAPRRLGIRMTPARQKAKRGFWAVLLQSLSALAA
jgi:hypothetical protein